jgi:hypothetical protein
MPIDFAFSWGLVASFEICDVQLIKFKDINTVNNPAVASSIKHPTIVILLFKL